MHSYTFGPRTVPLGPESTYVGARLCMVRSPNAGHEGGALSNRLPVTAVTVDFFRKGSYAPALAATAPLPPYAGEAAGSMRMEHDRLGRVIRRGSDTEAEVCMLWLQVRLHRLGDDVRSEIRSRRRAWRNPDTERRRMIRMHFRPKLAWQRHKRTRLSLKNAMP